jgi:hypothetical protein
MMDKIEKSQYLDLAKLLLMALKIIVYVSPGPRGAQDVIARAILSASSP